MSVNGWIKTEDRLPTTPSFVKSEDEWLDYYQSEPVLFVVKHEEIEALHHGNKATDYLVGYLRYYPNASKVEGAVSYLFEEDSCYGDNFCLDKVLYWKPIGAV